MEYVFMFIVLLSVVCVVWLYAKSMEYFSSEKELTEEVVIMAKETGNIYVISKYHFAYRTDMRIFEYIGDL